MSKSNQSQSARGPWTPDAGLAAHREPERYVGSRADASEDAQAIAAAMRVFEEGLRQLTAFGPAAVPERSMAGQMSRATETLVSQVGLIQAAAERSRDATAPGECAKASTT